MPVVRGKTGFPPQRLMAGSHGMGRRSLQKIIRNHWCRKSGEPFARAQILSHVIHPEGLDIDRIRFFEGGSIAPKSSVGHIIGVLRGSGKLHVMVNNRQSFRLEAGVHLYLPPGTESVLDRYTGTAFLRG